MLNPSKMVKNQQLIQSFRVILSLKMTQNSRAVRVKKDQKKGKKQTLQNNRDSTIYQKKIKSSW